jgi:hypothetical protein
MGFSDLIKIPEVLSFEWGVEKNAEY